MNGVVGQVVGRSATPEDECDATVDKVEKIIHAMSRGSNETRSPLSSASMAARSAALSGGIESTRRFSSSRAREEAFGMGKKPESIDQRMQSIARGRLSRLGQLLVQVS